MFALFNIDLFYQQSKIDSDKQDAEYKNMFPYLYFYFLHYVYHWFTFDI